MPIVVQVVAIGEYDQTVRRPFPSLGPGGHLADDEAMRIADILRPLEATVELDLTTPGLQRDSDWAKRQQTAWSDRPGGTSSIFIWIGHGSSDGSLAWLASAKSDARNPNSGHNATELAASIQMEWASRQEFDGAWCMVIVEACGADRFVDLLSAELAKMYSSAPRRIILVSAGGEGTSFLGTVSNALQDVLESFTDNDDSIDIWDFARRLNEHLDPYGGGVAIRSLAGATPLIRPKLLTAGITAPYDVAQEIAEFVASLPEHFRGHFLPKAQGAEQGEAAWYFTGRDSERRRIVRWFANHSYGLLVITGEPGSGKSALLGNLLVHTTVALRELLVEAGRVDRLPDSEQLSDHVFDVVLTLTGQTFEDAVKLVASSIGVPIGAESVAERIEKICAEAGHRAAGLTMLIDALDEAVEPQAIARALLRPLASTRRCRIILGTRRSTHEQLDLPAPGDENLIDALGDPDAFERIDLGPDSEAVERYARARLREAADQAYAARRATRDRLFEVAAEISEQSGQFLHARLAVHEILADPALILPENADELTRLLESDHSHLFAHAVSRLQRDSPASYPILEALAHAEGRGLPRNDGLWASVATALAGESVITDPDISGTLHAAAPYIMLDGEGGQSVYRLAHQTFREYFAVSTEYDFSLPTRRDIAVARALLDCATTRETTMNGYLRAHLSRHIAKADNWDALGEQPHVIDELDISALAQSALTSTRSTEGPQARRLPLSITGTLLNRPDIERSSADVRASLRRLGEARVTGHSIKSDPLPTPPVDVRWAVQFAPETPLIPALGHVGAVEQLVSVWLPSRDWILASVGADSTLRSWDPATGAERLEPVELRSTSHLALCSLGIERNLAILVVGVEAELRLIDADTGSSLSGGCEHDSPIRQLIAVPGPDGNCALSWRVDGSVYVCDPLNGAECRQLAAGAQLFNAISLLNGDVLAVAGAEYGEFEIFSISSPGISTTSVGRLDYPTEVQLVEGGGGIRYLAVASDDLFGFGGPLVSVYDASTGRPIADLSRPRDAYSLGPTRGMASFRPGVSSFLVTTDGHAVIFWDLVTREPFVQKSITGDLRTHTLESWGSPSPWSPQALTIGTRRSIAVIDNAAGREVAVLKVDSLDLTTIAALPARPSKIIALGARDGGIRFWKPFDGDGDVVGARRHMPGARDLQVFETDAESICVVSDGLVGSWDLRSGSQLALVEGRSPAVAFSRNANISIASASAAQNGVRLIDARTGSVTKRILRHRRILRVVADPRGGAIAVTRSSLGLSLWSVETGRRIGRGFKTQGRDLLQHWTIKMVLEGEQLIVLGSTNNGIHAWEAETGTLRWTVEMDDRSSPRFAAPASRSDAMVLLTNGAGRLLRVADGVEIRLPHELQAFGQAHSIRLDLEGDVFVAFEHNARFMIWQPRRGRLSPIFDLGRSSLKCLAFAGSLDSRNARLVSGHRDGSLCAWDTTSGELIDGVPTGAEIASIATIHGGVVCGTDAGLIRFDICDDSAEDVYVRSPNRGPNIPGQA